MDGQASAGAVARGLIKFNPSYLVSPLGILKLIEFVVLMLAWALCSGFRNGYLNVASLPSEFTYSTGGIGFFLFVTVTLWLIAIIFLVLGVLGLLDKLRIPMKMLLLAIFHGISALLLLISTAIIGDDAASFPSQWCDSIKKSTLYSTTCATYEAAVAFGAFSILAFVIDAVFHFFKYRSDGPTSSATV